MIFEFLINKILVAIFILLTINFYSKSISAEDKRTITALQPIRLPHIHRIYMYDLLPAIFDMPNPFSIIHSEKFRRSKFEDPMYIEISGGPMRTYKKSASTYGNMIVARAIGNEDLRLNFSGGATNGNTRLFNSYRTEISAFYGGLGLTSKWLSFHTGVLAQLGHPEDTTVIKEAKNEITIKGVEDDLSCNRGIICKKSNNYSFFAYYTLSKYALVHTLFSKAENTYRLDAATISILRFLSLQYIQNNKSVDAGAKIDSMMLFGLLKKSHPETFYAAFTMNNNYEAVSGNNTPYTSVRLGYWFFNGGLSYARSSSIGIGYFLGLNLFAFMAGKHAPLFQAVGVEASLSYFNRFPDYSLRYAEEEGIMLRFSGAM